MFEKVQYDLTATVKGNGAITQSAVQSKTTQYDSSTTVKLQAKPGQGYEFIKWEGDLTGSTNPDQIVINDPKHVTAVFGKKTNPLTVNTKGEGSVARQVVPAKSRDYDYGTTVELTATPSSGWKFVKWQGDLSGTDNPKQITVDTPKEVTAVFEKKSYALTTTTQGQGVVNEKVVKAKSYPYKTMVQFTAAPEQGWAFDHWEGDLSGSENPKTIAVDNPKEVKAVFARQSYKLAITKTGQGTVAEAVVKTKSYDYGTSVQLTATPATGWKFVKWQGDLSGTTNPATITVDNPKEVTAVFEKKSYPLTITKTGEGAVAETVVKSKSTNYDYGTNVELTATPSSGWKFVKWQGDLSGTDNPKQITVDTPKEVTAVFEKKSYALTINTQGQGAVNEEVVKAKSYKYGTMVQLTAAPEQGWAFDHWEGDLTGSGNPKQLSVDGPKEVTAVFQKKQYALTVNTEGQGTISKDPDQISYEYGSSVELTATPASGWEFKQWKGDLSGGTNPTTITVDSPKEVTALFEQKPFYPADNGITVKCPDAQIGDSGTINSVTYTKRSKSQITPSNAPTTCTSDITDMSGMFEVDPFMGPPDSPFNGDISSWDVSSVTDMGDMFYKASAFNQDISSWDVSSVTNMKAMFDNTNDFNEDLSNWDVSSVTDMSFMFKNASAFNGDLSSWCVTNISSEPTDFATNSALTNAHKPNWGTCPSP